MNLQIDPRSSKIVGS